jgi:hypothetical protein
MEVLTPSIPLSMRSAAEGVPSGGCLAGRACLRCDRIAATVAGHVDLAWKPLRLRGFLFDLTKPGLSAPGELDPSSPTLYQKS